MNEGLAVAVYLSLLLVTVSDSQVTVPDHIRQEIEDHRDGVNQIIDYIRNGAGRHLFFNKLAEFSDDHGPRLSSSDALEDAIDYTLATMPTEGYSNVHGEPVQVPWWERGDGYAVMTTPRHHQMEVLALGTSVGTPQEGITADVIVFRTFEELEQHTDKIAGKIVAYNQEWENYGQSVDYRNRGASVAARYNAVATLVRSVTPYSLNSPHVGVQEYEGNVTKIPSAMITVEDAQMMQRLQDRGKTITVHLNLTCRDRGLRTSRNIVADFLGNTYPDEYVILGGHMDSWDVGFGPMDDGGGVVMSWQVPLILEALGLETKRTIRNVFYTGEEFGVYGGHEYFNVNKELNGSISLIMESDAGTFKPLGIGFSGVDMARAIVQEIALLLEPINATIIGENGGQADINDWIDIGVPGGNLLNSDNHYFNYHHSHADSMTMEDPDAMDLCMIVWTAMTYVVADLEDKLPRSDSDINIGMNTCPGPLIVYLLVMIFGRLIVLDA